jgi:hypothetical protein
MISLSHLRSSLIHHPIIRGFPALCDSLTALAIISKSGQPSPAAPQEVRRSLELPVAVKTPFLLPPTCMIPGTVAKSAKFYTCSHTTASTRSKTRWDIASTSTW